MFDENGKLLGSSSSPIQIWKDGDCVEVMLNHQLNFINTKIVKHESFSG